MRVIPVTDIEFAEKLLERLGHSRPSEDFFNRSKTELKRLKRLQTEYQKRLVDTWAALSDVYFEHCNGGSQ